MTDLYKRLSVRLEKEWYPLHKEEWFSQEDIWKYFSWKDPETRHALSQKLYYDYKKATPRILEKYNRLYRVIDTELDEIDWMSADETVSVPLKLPFNLHDYVKLFPKSMIVVAGAPNAGKTAFLYNTIVLNMYIYNNIILYNSETSAEQMKDRFLKFGITFPNPPPFRTIERYDNFADIIDPDGISVIDYIDNDVEVYNNGLELSRLFKKLNKGIVIAALQKKPHTKNLKGQEVREDVGYGGIPTLKKAALYVSLNPGSLKIVKGKSWQTEVNPNGIMWTFKLINGAKFVNIERDYENER